MFRTSCYEVFRHNGFYFCWHLEDNGGYREPGLGWYLWSTIPTDKTEFQEWAQKMREKLDRIRKQYEENQRKTEMRQIGRGYIDFYVSWVYPRPFRISYIYEIDLDRLIFSVDGTPTYHLDNMPPLNIFYQTFEAKSGTYVGEDFSYPETVPIQYRFDITRLPVPAIAEDDRRLETYVRFCTGIVAAPHNILSLGGTLSPCEQVCLRVLENHVGVYIYERDDMITQDVRLGSDVESMGHQGRDIAVTLAASALLPLHVLGTMVDNRCAPWAVHYAGQEDDFWFIRKHICVHLTKHLHDKRYLQAKISDTVNKILSTSNGPDVVYGVIFSLVSCVVVRVDKASGGFFDHTEVLPFLPSITAGTGLTPGMELLRRLGNLRAEDDVDWFYSKLSPMWWTHHSPQEWEEEEETLKKKRKITKDASPLHDEVARRTSLSGRLARSVSSSFVGRLFATCSGQHVRSGVSKRLNLPQLPCEVLAIIAGYIAEPVLLFNFALASRRTMAASISRLRYPQLHSFLYVPCQGMTDKRFACFLESYEEPVFERQFHSCFFSTRFRGLPALLAITPDDMRHEWSDKCNTIQDWLAFWELENRFFIPNCYSRDPHHFLTPGDEGDTHPEFVYRFLGRRGKEHLWQPIQR